MMNKPENVTVVILSDAEAKELSVRHSLRCIGRDCWFLARAIAGHARRYRRTFTKGWSHKNRWWTQREL